LTNTMLIKDGSTTDVIEGAAVTLQMQIAGNWVTIDQEISDIFGIVQFELYPSKQYRIIVEADGYFTKQGEFYATTTQNTIVLNNENTQSFTTWGDQFTYTTAPNNVSRTLTNFTLTTNSPDGAIEWFAVQVTVNGTTSIQNVTASPGGGTANVQFNLAPYNNQVVSVSYMVKSVGFPDPMVVPRSFYLAGFTEGNYTLDSFATYYKDDSHGLTTVSRGILATIGAVIMGTLLGFIFGAVAAVIGAAATFIIAGWYGWIHPTIIFIVVAGLLGAVLLNGRGR